MTHIGLFWSLFSYSGGGGLIRQAASRLEETREGESVSRRGTGYAPSVTPSAALSSVVSPETLRTTGTRSSSTSPRATGMGGIHLTVISRSSGLLRGPRQKECQWARL